jgi:NADPH-dependent glutamate synthase beta subunit-like oxidoreductase/dihydroorotate dehydrogenase/Pyruvate/2-oxoacid:ferredoxin oxidoreductase delta subunit
METKEFFLTDAQLEAELEKCEYCEEKPCRDACPSHCSPADFIMAARAGGRSDYRRAALLIMTQNPLGGICGAICPDRHCQSACVHRKFDSYVNIPAVQAAIIARARALDAMPRLEAPSSNNRKAAIVGGGPAGLAAALSLAQEGYSVEVFEREKKAGGMCNLIPEDRLPREVLKGDLAFTLSGGNVKFSTGASVEDPESLLSRGFEAVVVATGLSEPIKLGIQGEELGVPGIAYLWEPEKYPMKGRVAVIGGGATAVDCAVTAGKRGAASVELLALESLSEMPLTPKERQELLDNGIQVSGRTRVLSARGQDGRIQSLKTIKVTLPEGAAFSLRDIREIPGTESERGDFEHLIIAIGSRAGIKRSGNPAVFFAGDCDNGPTTVVEASAAGKNAALRVHAFLSGSRPPSIEKEVKSFHTIPGGREIPVPLDTDFFGRKILSPFILSAAPPTDGYEQMKKAYEAGWAGGIMKTAFDNVPIHIPGEYMHAFSETTYGNCDNVSGHPLDRVCSEISRLVGEYPERLTIGSTGGPVTGDDEHDRKGWQGNTLKLEKAGAMGIEYSLSCPQGGDGTEGDIVSQNARLTAKIIGWILEAGNPEIPKLFKLTAAVTSIAVIIRAIKEVLGKYPKARAGVTLANTFPTLFFRPGEKKEWEEGILVGMSGEGVTPISNLTLASVSSLGVVVSGNGGPMDYKAAADFLALGARTVQFCTIAMKHGYGIVRELHSGLSHLMEERNIRSVEELIGIALPGPITDFMALSPVKKISACREELCLSCGNCTRCPYMAVTLNEKKNPVTDAEKCIGCSICVQKCFSGALYMRERTSAEAAALREN